MPLPSTFPTEIEHQLRKDWTENTKINTLHARQEVGTRAAASPAAIKRILEPRKSQTLFCFLRPSLQAASPENRSPSMLVSRVLCISDP
jgi:hypothetical protein